MVDEKQVESLKITKKEWDEQKRKVAEYDRLMAQQTKKEPEKVEFVDEDAEKKLDKELDDILKEKPKCPNCGSEIDEGTSQCSSCNAEIEWKE